MAKGMSTTLVIVVSAVVILITALVVIGVFTGGLGNFQNIFNPWVKQTGISTLCQSKCQTGCFTGSPPLDTYYVEVDGEQQVCPICDCTGTQNEET